SSLLIISSVFSQILLRWVPVLISYSNGATSTHYEQHFLALLESIARIVDFSDGERSGFIGSFVRFWLKQSNPRTAEELQRKGATLLRGCRQHFEASITRVKRITAIVPVDQQPLFSQRVRALLKATSPEILHQLADSLESDFPKIRPWLQWWMSDKHATMLFESKRSMDPAIWDSLPETTNPEESMHFSMY
ncbi:hypothetical protein BDP27DRAFT_1199913, partial [Rhodocollybia butyracea]